MNNHNQLDHERLESLVNSMADGVIATDPHGKIVLYNGAALNILDINKISKGDDIADILVLRSRKGKKLDTAKIVAQTERQTISRDYTIRYSDKSLANIYLSISPVKQGYGKEGEGGFVLIVRDITHEKSLEEERDEFISVVSHELRTPVATIEGSLDNALFIAEKKPESVKKVVTMLKNAHAQALYLEDMINDLTTLARAERGVLKDSVAILNPHTITESLLSTYSKQAQAKGLTMSAHIDPNIQTFRSIELYVREILQNFVTNAIKYTEKGSITLSARPTENGVEFLVQDTGIGISKSDQKKVFNKFFRSEDHLTRKQKGTGLGLHVTQKLAKMTKAEITLESELGSGSTFSVFFPNLTS